MTLSDRPLRRTDVSFHLFDDEVLLYDPADGTGLWLNATASLIWQLSDGQRTIAAIIGLLEETYPAAAHQMAREVQDAIALLVANRAVGPA